MLHHVLKSVLHTQKKGGTVKLKREHMLFLNHVDELSDMLLNQMKRRVLDKPGSWEFSVKGHLVNVWHRWNLLLEVFMLKIVLFCVLV